MRGRLFVSPARGSVELAAHPISASKVRFKEYCPHGKTPAYQRDYPAKGKLAVALAHSFSLQGQAKHGQADRRGGDDYAGSYLTTHCRSG